MLKTNKNKGKKDPEKCWFCGDRRTKFYSIGFRSVYMCKWHKEKYDQSLIRRGEKLQRRNGEGLSVT